MKLAAKIVVYIRRQNYNYCLLETIRFKALQEQIDECWKPDSNTMRYLYAKYPNKKLYFQTVSKGNPINLLRNVYERRKIDELDG